MNQISSLMLMLMLLTLCADASRAAVVNDFEGPTASWTAVGNDVAYRTVVHARTQADAHRGRASEQIRISAGHGTYVYFLHPIDRAIVIPELVPSLWMKADRPGLQILARVVLPRSKDPRSGQPRSVLIRGSSYSRLGSWEQLKIEEVPLQVQREVRVLRSQLGGDVDAAEAYINAVLVNVYGGADTTSAWIDDLEISGQIDVRTPYPVPRESGPRESGPREATPRDGSRGMVSNTSSTPAPLPGETTQQVRLQGSLLLVEGKPLLPRIIEHRGESFERLKELGFNTIQLAAPPTSQDLEDAARLGLWLVCPPPVLQGSATISKRYERVLAWNLGGGLTSLELQETRQTAEKLRAADVNLARPLLATADSDLRAYSRLADVLGLNHRPLGSSLSLADYHVWLRQRAYFARPGAPLWTGIQTEAQPALAAQVARLGLTSMPPVLDVESDQIRLTTYAAVAAGSRGLVFRSSQPLDREDRATRLRAATLELLNLELSLIEPWAAAGAVVGTMDPSDDHLRVASVQLERSRLLLITRLAPWSQLAVQPMGRDVATFTVPGVPESSEAFHVTPSGLRPLRHRRVTGGVQITLEDPAIATMVVITSDALVMNSMTRRLATQRARAARLRQQIAALTLETIEETHAQIAARTKIRQAEAWLGESRSLLMQADQLITANDLLGGDRLSNRAMEASRRVSRADWEVAAQGFQSPTASPLLASYSTLPLHFQLTDRLRSARLSENQLVAGDCENLDGMISAGWKQMSYEQPGLKGIVELSTTEPAAGKYALRLNVAPIEPEAGQGQVESSPVWVTTAPVRAEPGQLVRVQAWVRIDKPIVGSQDGLMVFDSFGGMALGQRVRQTSGWQAITFYRLVSSEEPMRVTFALTGIGEAFVDDVRISLFSMSEASGLPPGTVRPETMSPGIPQPISSLPGSAPAASGFAPPPVPSYPQPPPGYTPASAAPRFGLPRR